MNYSDILLVIISSAGLLHGLLLAFYLFFLKKKRSDANLLLGLMLVFMAFRVGKSVMMNFGDDLKPLFIFAGLALLLLIGPLLRWYVTSMTSPNFKFNKKKLLETIPFTLFFLASFFLTQGSFKEDKWLMVAIASTLLFIYTHFAFYIFLAWRRVRKLESAYKEKQWTKAQKSVLDWLYVLIIGFVFIWISYFLNLIEEKVPYVIGPIMYSIVVYFLGYKAYSLKSTDLDGNVFKNEDKDALLFVEIFNLVIDGRRYLEPDISLAKVSKLIGHSSQKTSAVINQHAQHNFNDFINYHRIQEAKKKLSDSENHKFTISSIAFDIGFGSLSSFNSAFKKFEGITPSVFRKQHTS